MPTWRQDELLIASVFVSMAIICSFYQIIKHLMNFHEPKLQLYIVRIILIVPVSPPQNHLTAKTYGISSYLSLALPNSAMIFDTLRDW